MEFPVVHHDEAVDSFKTETSRSPPYVQYGGGVDFGISLLPLPPDYIPSLWTRSPPLFLSIRF